MLHSNSCRHSMYSSRVKDNEKDFTIEIPVPGFDKKDVNIKIKDNYILLKGDNEEYKFEKAYELNDKIDVEKISAEVEKGVLKVTLPKSAPTYREIAIN